MDTLYKSPYGAVETGTVLTFQLTPERGLGVMRPELCYWLDGEDQVQCLPMAWQALQGGQDIFSVHYQAPDVPGLVWYAFRFLGPEGPMYLGPSGLIPGTAGDAFQLTVYQAEPDTASWFGQGITYQIFPDRFRRTAVPETDRKIHADWYDMPQWKPDAQGIVRNDDFFGGSFQGIQEKLPYLKDLGVSTLYLNPIFQAASNHRYDTGDYLRTDPLLGTETAFTQLCQAAADLGIRVVLDGVFSHTGSDSRYFNALGHYDSVGAAQSQDSPYYPWYSFSDYPKTYSAWWGIDTLPQVNELEPSYLEFITGADGVCRRWLRLGAAGWRLDVADELPDEFIRRFKAAARAEKPDALVIGEVWEDASNKVSYGVRRKYILGGMLDSVMNYPFKNAAIAYAQGGAAAAFRDAMEAQRANYPSQVSYNLMNFLGTHDTPRILTVLGADRTPESKDERAAYRLSPAEYDRGVRRLQLASGLMYCYVGAPTIYYGDEAGMEGFEDPFNRRGFPWGREDQRLTAHYRRLGQIRNGSVALREGDIRYMAAEGTVLAFQRQLGRERVLFAANSGEAAQTLQLPAWAGRHRDLMTGEMVQFPKAGLPLAPQSFRILG